MFERFSARASDGGGDAVALMIPPRRPRAARRRHSSPRIEGLEVRINLTTATLIAITPPAITTTYGDQASFTAEVSSTAGTPTGTVDFYNGDPNAGGQALGTNIALDGAGDASFQISTLPVTPAGTPDQIYAVFHPTDTSIFDTSSTPTPSSLTITPANLSITANGLRMTYADGTTLDGTAGFTAAGLVNGDSVSSVTLATDATASTSGHWNAGSWSITPSSAQGSGLSNYNITYNTGTLTVSPATLNVTGLTAQGKTYDGNTAATISASAATLQSDEVVAGDDVSLNTAHASLSGSGHWNVGSWSITPSNAQGSGLSNYTITYDDGALTVNHAALTVAANDVTSTYGDGTALDGANGFTATGLVGGDVVGPVTLTTDATLSGSGHRDAGNWSITPSAATGADAANYANGALTVNRAALTITANDVTSTYGDGTTLDGTSGFTPTGLASGDIVSTVDLATDATMSGSGHWDAGNWAITPSNAVGTDLGNYTITYINGALNVAPKAVTITGITATGKTYDATTTAQIDSSGAAIQAGGVVTGDDVGLNASAATGQFASPNAGAQSVVISGLVLTGADANNYTPQTSVSATIAQAGLTITAKDVTSTYGDGTTLNGNTGFTPSQLFGTDSVTSVTLATDATMSGSGHWDAGTWTITPSNAAGSGVSNYNITYANGTLTVSPKALGVTADSQTMTYGGTVPNLTYTASGFASGDTASTALTGSLATTATSGSHVGNNYGITQGTLAAVGGNYAITFQGAKLTVTPASLTVTVSNASKVYGAALPTFSVSYSGFVNGDDARSLTTPPAVTTSATSSSGVGVYGLNASGAGSADYNISYVPGNLVITKANSSANLNGSISTAVVGQTATYSVQVAPVSPGGGEPTGTVTFLVDGTPIGTVNVDSQGQASLSTTAIGKGSHAVTASYSGDANFQSSQSTSSQIVVSPAGTQAVLSTQAVRNKKGKIVSVNLVSTVSVNSPGSGVPGGFVTFYRKAHKLKTVALSGARAALNLKQNQAVNKTFSVQYGGGGDFTGSTSTPIKITKGSLKSSARPALARHGHSS